MNALLCRDCGLVFERAKQRGRPPVRCQSCRDKITLDQQVVVDLVDPETLYSGPAEKLLGTRRELPQGNEAQCPLVGCGRIFTSDSSCESHKIYHKDGPTICIDPSTIGMVPKDRRNIPVWTRPAPPRWE